MIDPLTERAIATLRDLVAGKKAQAWKALLFDEKGNLTRDAEIVLGDLRRFCRANRPTFDRDPQISALLQGRREVWLRINSFLGLDDAQVRKLVEVEDEYY